MVKGIKDYFKVLWVSFVSWSQAIVEDDGEPEVRKIKLSPSSICTYETEKPEDVRRKLSIKKNRIWLSTPSNSKIKLFSGTAIQGALNTEILM